MSPRSRRAYIEISEAVKVLLRAEYHLHIKRKLRSTSPLRREQQSNFIYDEVGYRGDLSDILGHLMANY